MVNKKRIDPHVHFRDEEQNYKETIKHGLKVASEQSVDIVFDMPNTFKPVLTGKDVKRRLKLVPEDQEKRYKMYVGVTSDENQVKEAVGLVKKHDSVIGLKMFAGKSTGNLALINENEQKKVYQILAELKYKGVIAVHCEKEILMGKVKFDPDIPITHALSRPCIAEVESVSDQISFAKETGFNGVLHICHVSCPKSIEIIKKAREKGINFKITCGVTPHHLLWDESMLETSHGLLYKMNPPLRNRESVLELREAVLRGEVDWIETDHAPHTIGEKLHSGHPSGYPSLYLYSDIVEDFLPTLGVDDELIKKMTYDNIVETFGLGDK